MEPAKHAIGSSKWPIVFFDMDGVLCDFVTDALQAIYEAGLTAYTPKKLLERWAGIYPGEWDICTVAEITKRDLWETIHAKGWSFWSRLLPTPLFYELGVFSETHSDVEFCVSSSPSNHESSYSGKAHWLFNHGFNLANAMLGSQKHLLAAPGRILVDDNDANCERWRAHGGMAVLVPQVWNNRHTIAANGPDAIWETVERELLAAIDN